MNKVSKQQIKDLVIKIALEQDEYWNDTCKKLKLNIIKDTDKELLFEVTQMYESPFKSSFKVLKEFSELFGTDNIDVYEDISNQGCETCDYGSSYGYAIRVWE